MRPWSALPPMAALILLTLACAGRAQADECGPSATGDLSQNAIAALRQTYALAATGDPGLEERLTATVWEGLEARGLSTLWLVQDLDLQALDRLEVFDMHGTHLDRTILYARQDEHRRQYRMTCEAGHWRVAMVWSRQTGRIPG